MITLTLDYREVLWWMQGGMAGSHIRWSVYEDMVNNVWPQCSEQERRNLHYLMRRDLGSYWRPDGWSGYKEPLTGECEWKPTKAELGDRTTDEDGRPLAYIFDETPWTYFRQVLARFDPDQQYAVTIRVHNQDEMDEILRLTPAATIISRPSIPRTAAMRNAWQSDTATVTVRAYRWHDPDHGDHYRIDWLRRVSPDIIVKAEKLEIPDTGEM